MLGIEIQRSDYMDTFNFFITVIYIILVIT